nr:hypothetical protein [Tanacetum cinerariifolium]
MEHHINLLMFQKGDDPIDAINHMMSFLIAVVTSRYPPTNNQLRTSSNPRQQATINNGRVTIQPIQGRQNSMTAGMSRQYISGPSGTSRKQRVIVCYNCKGECHMSNQCTKPKRKRDEVWFKDKIATQKAKIATLKAEAVGKKNSRPTGTPTKPKVLTSGMYTKSSKYIPLQKRADWVQPTLLPKKKQVTFLEPHRTSPRSTQKPPVQHKKPTFPVNMFPKAKPATEARKPIPKRNTQNHNPLPAKSVKARRAADYYRNLYVDITIARLAPMGYLASFTDEILV